MENDKEKIKEDLKKRLQDLERVKDSLKTVLGNVENIEKVFTKKNK